MSPAAANLVSGLTLLASSGQTQNLESLTIVQVQYGYQLSGENDPPFGCIETDNVTPAISFKFVCLRLLSY